MSKAINEVLAKGADQMMPLKHIMDERYAAIDVVGKGLVIFSACAFRKHILWDSSIMIFCLQQMLARRYRKRHNRRSQDLPKANLHGT